MEKLILTPKGQEIIVNNGSTDGAVDLFSYGPEMEPAARTLGSLYVLGWRQADTNTMGYMVSLIAALARREYYAQPTQAPKEAFARTLRKINEVVEEFFKSEGIDLAVGIFAIAGGSVMVSKLDKFKVLLAREGQVIDILNNVMLFSKEHLEKRRFSSIISGSVQVGDRLLAYYPAKHVVARERALKGWLLNEQGESFAARLTQLGQENPAFGAAFMQIDMVQNAAPVLEIPEAQPAPAPEAVPMTPPVVNTPPNVSAGQPDIKLAWSPRQQSAPGTAEPEPEVPHLIAAEFSLGTRQSSLGRWFSRLRFIRLDGRGKAIILVAASLVIVGGVLVAKSILFVSAEDEKLRQVVQEVTTDFELGKSKATTSPTEARTILMRALATLAGHQDLAKDGAAKNLTAAISATLDDLDNAESADASVLAQLNPDNDRIALATWSSSSQSIWAVTMANESPSVVRIGTDGLTSSRTALTDVKPDILAGYRDGVLVVDTAKRAVVRVSGGTTSSYTIPTQENILDAIVYADALYVLTDRSILKVSDLETQKQVTKQWLTDQTQLSVGAARILVDGNVYTMGRDGTLATYYKGKKTTEVKTLLEPSGSWRLVPTNDPALFAITSADRLRVYEFAIADGSLARTLKLDSEQPLVLMAEGPDGSVIAVTKDNRIWKLQ
jgi:hypothetical protein